MAPLPAAFTAPTPAAAPKGGSAGTAPPDGAAAPFASLLGLHDAPAGPADAGLPTSAVALADTTLDAGELLADTLDPAAEDVLPAAMTGLQDPAPDAPWPPTGLGGLFGAAGGDGLPPVRDASASGLQGRGTGGLKGVAGLPVAGLPHGTLASAALPAAAPSAAPASTLADAVVAAAAGAGAGAADAMAAAIAASPVEGAEPAPPAFTLPQAPAAPALRDAAPLLAAPVPTPDVRTGDFGERFGAQLQWMAGQNIGHARIQVTPHDLGPVEVLLHMDGDTISADFISSHAETRQALEQGLPRLRDLLGEHGFQLAHAGVGSEGPAPQDGGRGSAPGDRTGQDGTTEPAAGTPAPMRTLRGLVDAYA